MRLDKRFIGEEFTIPKRKFVALPTNLLGKNNDISKDIYDLIDRTYKPIGGHIDFKKQTDLPSDFTFWIGADVDKDPDVDARNVVANDLGFDTRVFEKIRRI